MSPRYKDFEEKFDAMREERRHGRKERPERNERSWRDIDRGRDRSAHSDQTQSPQQAKGHSNRYQDAQAEKAVREQLEGLFGDKEGDALAHAILNAGDRAAIQAAVDEYIEQRGTLPGDPTLLEKALDCRSDKTLRSVLSAIGTHLGEMEPVHRKVLLLKMKTKARSTFDRKVSGAIKELLAEYGSDD